MPKDTLFSDLPVSGNFETTKSNWHRELNAKDEKVVQELPPVEEKKEDTTLDDLTK